MTDRPVGNRIVILEHREAAGGKVFARELVVDGVTITRLSLDDVRSALIHLALTTLGE